jgi:hypothetical protein
MSLLLLFPASTPNLALLSGAAVGQAAATATPVVVVPLTGTVVGQASVLGVASGHEVSETFDHWRGGRPLVTLATGVESFDAWRGGRPLGRLDLGATAAPPIALTGSVAGQAAASATSTILVPCVGSSAGQAAANATARVVVPLTSATTAAAAVAATLYVVRTLGALNAQGQATASATMYVVASLGTGLVVAGATATAAPTLVVPTTASAFGQATVSASLTPLVTSIGAAVGQATLAATLHVLEPFAALASGQATASAAPVVVQIAVPTSDLAIGGWTTESGGTANLFASIDDNPIANDSDYIRSSATPTNDTARFTLTPLEIPDTGPVTLVVRVRSV